MSSQPLRTVSPLDSATRVAVRGEGAFTLVETALIVCLLGAVLAVAVPTFVRAVQTSKISEASQQLEMLYRASASYYAVPRPDVDGHNAFCLPEAAGPAPAAPSEQPVSVDFADAATPGAATWKALFFAPKEPLRYRYTYLPTHAGCRLPVPAKGVLSLRAEGDLDEDGLYSRFERSASIQAPGELVADPMLRVRDRIE